MQAFGGFMGKTLHHKNISEITPYVNNSRTHSQDQINQIAKSINEFGFLSPIVIDDDGTIIAGHGRYEAAKKINLEVVPCVVASGLTESQKKAYVIADNKIQENSGWNEDLLRIEIESIGEIGFDVNILGFSEKEMSKIFDETSGIKIEDSLDEKNLDCIMIKFNPSDKVEVMNVVNKAISKFKDACIWIDSDE